VRPAAADASVVIPTRDRPDWLPRALLSALSQRGASAEVIVVDDGSERPVLERLTAEGRKRIRVIRHEAPRGIAAARNSGIEAASGTWVAFLDDDDLWAPTKLDRLLGLAQESDADLAFSGGVFIDGAGQVLGALEPGPFEQAADLHRALLAANVIPFSCSNVIARTEAARAISGFDDRFVHLADWDFLIRLSEAGGATATPEPLVAYTLHSGNLHLEEAMVPEDLALLESKHQSRRTELGVSIDRSFLLEWRANASARAGDHRRAALAYAQLGWRRRRPGQIARAAAIGIGGSWAVALGRRVRPGGEHAGIRPPWLDEAVNPPPGAIGAVWR
jgi:glycosyltransferase involved in cell wall biosynthesis